MLAELPGQSLEADHRQDLRGAQLGHELVESGLRPHVAEFLRTAEDLHGEERWFLREDLLDRTSEGLHLAGAPDTSPLGGRRIGNRRFLRDALDAPLGDRRNLDDATVRKPGPLESLDLVALH